MPKTLLVLLLALAAWCAAFAGESYAFLFVSDTHFGPEKSFYTGPEKSHRTKKDPKRADQAMPLYEKLFAEMAKEPDVKFLVHAGDMIEGNARDEATHRKVLTDAINFHKRFFGFPLYFVKGNHEAKGLGGEEAYRAVLLPVISETAGKKLDAANYAVNYGDDLFVCVEYDSPDWFKFLKLTLEKQKTRPRYTFFVIHLNLIPFVGRNMPEACELLSRYNGIILCGHSHRTMLLKYAKDGGYVAQLTVSTLLAPAEKKNRVRRFDTDLAAFEAIFRQRRLKTPEQNERFDRLWKPYLTEYREAPGAAGYMKVLVSDAGVKAVFHPAAPDAKPVTFVLRGKENGGDE